MKTQSLNTLQSATTIKHAEKTAANSVQPDRSAFSPSWATMGAAQKTLKPATQNALHAGLLKPVQAPSHDPGDNGKLSVDQVIELVEATASLDIKVKILRAYVTARAHQLSATEVTRLAKHTKIPGEWSGTEKAHHDELLALYLENRSFGVSPDEALLLARAAFRTGRLDDAIVNYVKKSALVSALSPQRIIDLLQEFGSLPTKVGMLRAYVQERGPELPADQAVALAGEAKLPGEWTNKEKKHHDAVLKLWMEGRRDAGALSFDGLAKVVGKVFRASVSDQMLLDYLKAQKPSLDEHILLASLARTSATTETILDGIDNDVPDLSYEQIARLVKGVRYLAPKVNLLQIYVEARGTELSTDQALALAQEAKTPGTWSEEEKGHHDALLRQWVQLRLAADSLSFGDVLKVARKAFDSAVSDQMLLDYVLSQKPSLAQRIHLAALVQDSKIATAILEEGQS